MKLIALSLILISHLTLLHAQNLTGVRIYVNPGHGGFDADDRNVVIAPFTSGDRNGFWESQSNLDKGLYLRTMLQSSGASVSISRTTNTTADDLPLSQIVSAANTFQADFMLSIHTNAGNGVANFVLQIHYGADLSDTQVYNNYNPGNPAQLALSNKSRDISTEIAKNLHSNQITTWSSGYQVRGDKTFARTVMGFSDGYGVLRGLAVPGVISENGMHDYIPETYRLMNMEYKWIESWQFYKSFLNYFNGGQMTTGVVAGLVRDSRIKNEANYHKFAGVDQMLPLNGTKLTVVETGETYTVDNMNNGVFLFKDLAPGKYTVLAEKSGYYSKTHEVTVTAHTISYLNFDLNRVRNTPPQVLSFTPNVVLTDSVEASTTISFQFNWDMDMASTERAFSISPTISGKFTWEDTNYRLRFTPDKPLDKNTLYTVTLDKAASHPDNLSMVEDVSFQFRTKSRNRLALLASYPNATTPIIYTTNPNFRLIFDGKLLTTNLNTTIKVVDAANSLLAKSTRSVANNSIMSPYGSHYYNLASPLVVGNSYSLQIDGDVIDEVNMRVVEPIIIPFRIAALPLLTEQPIRDFETLDLVYQPALSQGVTSATSDVNTQSKLFGAHANRLQASLQAMGSNATYHFNSPVEVTADKVVSVYVLSDLSFNSVELIFTSQNQTRYVKLCDLSFSGWELREIGLTELEPNTTFQLVGLRIVRTSPYLFGNASTVFFDNLYVRANFFVGVRKPQQIQFKVFPNPATDKIQIESAIQGDLVMELRSLNGQLVRRVKARSMVTSDLVQGMYLLRIEAHEQVHTQPIIIQ